MSDWFAPTGAQQYIVYPKFIKNMRRCIPIIFWQYFDWDHFAFSETGGKKSTKAAEIRGL